MSRTPIASILAAVALLGCNPERNEDPPGNVDARLARFDSCNDLRDYVGDAYLEMLVQSRYGGWGWYGAEDDVAAEGDGDSSGPTDYSTTNVQEQGVDEPDLVKTDGNYLYIAQQNVGELTIVKSWPAESTAKVASLEVDGYPYSMFLRGDRIVLFSYVYDLAEARYGYGTRISIIDVSNREAPAVLREIDIEGWMADARMIEDDVYVVLNTWADMPEDAWNLAWDESLGLPEMDWEASEVQQAATRAEARGILRPHVDRIVADMDLDDMLPTAWDHAPDEVVDGEPLVDCGDVYHPDGISRPSMLTVAHLELDAGDGSDLTATGLMSDGWTVYASQESLYITQTSWWWWWGWGDLDLETHIHKFTLDGADTVYEASGQVDGWVLNQFSMSEHEGYLRVATTDWNTWWWTDEDEEDAVDPANNLFVLEQDGNALNTVGEITGIAPNERIYSARFQGDRGYLVTFEQIDPLFTFDLSDAHAPKIVGELKVPGFSSYLHPIGTDHLLAVGMDGTEDGEITGLAISLFDVSDFANPALKDKLVIESDDWSWSEALWDHHAFTYHRDNLSLPIYTWDYDSYGGFSGLLSVDVDLEAGLTETGRIGHEDLVDASDCLYEDYYGADACGDWYWYAWMRRSVVIEDNLFSISDYGIKVNDLTAPETEIARVLFYPAE